MSLHPGPVPFHSFVKYVVTARSPFDQIVSIVHHVETSNASFLKAWGLDDPVHGQVARLGSVEKIVALMACEEFPVGLWDFYNNAWDLRKKPNVFLQHFADLKNDLMQGIRRLSKFLEHELTVAELEKVHTHCTFDWMKQHEDQFNASKIGLCTPDGELIEPIHPTGIIREGAIGAHIHVLSDEQRAIVLAVARKNIKESACLEWIFNGGETG
jgi:hypothetical protein